METSEVTTKPKWTCECGCEAEVFVQSAPQTCKNCGIYVWLKDGKPQPWRARRYPDSFRWVAYNSDLKQGFIISTWSAVSRLTKTLNLFEALKDEGELQCIRDEIHDAHALLDDCGIHRERPDGELLTLCERIEIQDNSFRELMRLHEEENEDAKQI